MSLAGAGSAASLQDVRLVIDVPDGRLLFGCGDLDLWAEHLVWCYELLGVKRGATIAVQDFGTSPLAFLGSALLMPHLNQGVAERLGGKFICLDATADRVALTPFVLTQLEIDLFVVRAEVVGLLGDACRKAAFEFAEARTRTVVAMDVFEPVPAAMASWRRLLLSESAMLIAPECEWCGCFHLRAGLYRLEDGAIRNLRLKSAQNRPLNDHYVIVREPCAKGPEDLRIRRAGEPCRKWSR
jgi:hypothetical protein